MRDIKYRGLVIEPLYSGDKWIKSEGELREVYLNYADCTAYIDGHEVVWDSVTEYTGFKDIKGRDIYEGDIIETDLMVITSDIEIGVVVFIEGRWCIDTGSSLIGLFDEIQTKELLGNIYENSELLQGGLQNNEYSRIREQV